MNEKEHKYKLKISLKLNSHKFSPSEEVEGILVIYPSKDININNVLKNSDLYITLKEKIAYKYLESCSQTFIIDQKVLKFKDIKNDKNNSDDNIQIPIKYILPGNSTENFYPSFRYFSKSVKCIISHSLIVEIPFISNKTSINIFIRKMPIEQINSSENQLNKDIFGDELIKKFFLFNSGKLSYFIRTKKSISYKEKYPVEIHIDERDLGNVKIESINMKIKKKIFLYNESNIFADTLEENYDIKELKLNSSQKNNTIIETFELPLIEFNPLSLNDILKINYDKSNFNFTPPVDTFLFKCYYNFEIIFKFDSSFIEDKKINIPIDYYDNEYNIKNNDEEDKIEVVNNINKNINNNDNDNDDEEFNKIFDNNKNKNIINENKNDNNNNIDYNGFIDITKEDFIKTLDGNK